MSLSPEITARIQAVEAKLSELDPIFQSFCAETGCCCSSQIGVWPRRRVWRRDEIDRVLDLTTDLTVPEVMERGFCSEMLWSLYATASLLPAFGAPDRVLFVDVFRHLPFSELAPTLAGRLKDGLIILRGFTQEDIIAKGQILGRTA